MKQKIIIPNGAAKKLKALSQKAFPYKKDGLLRKTLFLTAVWIIITDKLYESNKVSLKNLDLFKNCVNRIILKNNHACPEFVFFSEPLNIFIRINAIIKKCGANSNLLALWRKSVLSFMSAMRVERSYSLDLMPSFSDYLQNGKKSIGSDASFYALFVVYGKDAPRFSLNELAIIKKVMEKASAVLRLANDLGSYEREKKEKKINSLDILKKDFQSLKTAKWYIIKQMRFYNEGLKKCRQSSSISLRPFIAALCRIV